MPAKKRTKSPASAKKGASKKTAPKRKLSASPKSKLTAAKSKAPAKLAVAKKLPGFSKTDLAHFKEIILSKRKEIMEDLDSLKESMMDTTTGEYVSENSSYSVHMEQGTDAMEREKTFLFAARESKFLNYLDDALKRVEKGDYGRCVDCNKLIERERLEAVPHAQLCLRCKLKRAR